MSPFLAIWILTVALLVLSANMVYPHFSRWRESRKPKGNEWHTLAGQFASESRDIRNVISTHCLGIRDDLNQGFKDGRESFRDNLEMRFDQWRDANTRTAGAIVDALKVVCETIREHAPNPITMEAMVKMQEEWMERRQKQVLESLDRLTNAVRNLETETANQTKAQVAATEKVGTLIARHLEIQKRVSRTLEGRPDNDDQELVERAMALREEHPEMTIEECIARIRHVMPYQAR